MRTLEETVQKVDKDKLMVGSDVENEEKWKRNVKRFY